MLVKDIIFICESVLGNHDDHAFDILRTYFYDQLHDIGFSKVMASTARPEDLQSLAASFAKFTDDGSIALRRLLRVVAGLEAKAVIASPFESDRLLANFFNLSPSSLQAASKILLRLHKADLLDGDAYLAVIKAVSKPLKKPVFFYGDSAFVDCKRSRYRQFFVLPDYHKERATFSKFYLKENAGIIGEGAYGQVQRAVASLRSHGSLAVKWYGGPYKEGLELAKHEYKYHQLMYPTRRSMVLSYGFYNVALCYNWFHGGKLGGRRLNNKKIKLLGLDLRLKLLQTLLKGLNVLHKNYRVHGDIAFDNIIYDHSSACLKLMDFNLSAKPATSRFRLFRHQTADRYLVDNINTEGESTKCSFPDDLYVVAIIAASFFPEVFDSLGIYGFYPKHTAPEKGYTANEQGIKELILAIWHKHDPRKNRELRASMPTTAMALDYIDKMLDSWSVLNDKKLKEMANKTIYKKDITVDDVIHGHLRPLSRSLLAAGGHRQNRSSRRLSLDLALHKR